MTDRIEYNIPEAQRGFTLIKIEDDVLKQEEFDKIQKIMTEPSSFPWFYNYKIDSKDDVDKFQFIHIFYNTHMPPIYTPFINELSPLLEVIKAISILRIKANLLTRTPNIIENTLHTDLKGISEEKLKQLTTSIFYINTNNGYTKFEDGAIVESVANRMVTFPTNLKHTGTSCTDERTRIVINFNYFKNT